MSYDSIIGSIADQSGKVNEMMTELGKVDDPKKMIKASMELMQEQQKLTIMSESFTKTMKANHDAAKSAITNMH
jgi:hypothetical protein